MKCPECQFENSEDSNFCLECGRKLEQKCPQCEKMLPLNANFCNACGHKLRKESSQFQTELSFDDKLAKIQKYLQNPISKRQNRG